MGPVSIWVSDDQSTQTGPNIYQEVNEKNDKKKSWFPKTLV